MKKIITLFVLLLSVMLVGCSSNGQTVINSENEKIEETVLGEQKEEVSFPEEDTSPVEYVFSHFDEESGIWKDPLFGIALDCNKAGLQNANYKTAEVDFGSAEEAAAEIEGITNPGTARLEEYEGEMLDGNRSYFIFDQDNKIYLFGSVNIHTRYIEGDLKTYMENFIHNKHAEYLVDEIETTSFAEKETPVLKQYSYDDYISGYRYAKICFLRKGQYVLTVDAELVGQFKAEDKKPELNEGYEYFLSDAEYNLDRVLSCFYALD